jgi:hypothetical protein
MSVIDEINAISLDPELMKEMMTCVAEMRAEQRGDMTGRARGLIRLLEERLSDQKPHTRAATLISFEFRMEALVRLRRRPEFRAWTIKAAKTGAPDLIHEVMIDTAASEPLIERNYRPAFDPVSFFRKALERVEAEGRG